MNNYNHLRTQPTRVPSTCSLTHRAPEGYNEMTEHYLSLLLQETRSLTEYTGSATNCKHKIRNMTATARNYGKQTTYPV